jgi:hypothetical protein
MREQEMMEAGSLAPREWLAVGLGAGLFGGIALALPILIWDWANSAHLAFELPMAATAWLFGLQHFSHDVYVAWPLVIGVALLTAYVALSGILFTGLADRVYGIARPLPSMAAGFAWGFVNFMFFWYMLLPIARDGAPFRAAAGAPELFVAPNWTWILGFTLLGLVTGACYAAFRVEPVIQDERVAVERPLRRVA